VRGAIGRLSITDDEAREAARRALRRPRPIAYCGSVAERVANHAALRPDAVAFTTAAGDLTYREVVSSVAAVREMLTTAGCRAGSVVAAVGERSATTVVLFLAIEDLGAVYVPLDVRWPLARIRQILGRCHVNLLATYGSSPLAGQLADLADAVVPLPSFDCRRSTRVPSNPPGRPAVPSPPGGGGSRTTTRSAT
jgi:D-alanine--poly(phosphoribitol) ligase subunit 1